MNNPKAVFEEPRIEHFTGKTLVGQCVTMSFSNNTTKKLWQTFMPRRRELKSTVGNELYSLEVYPSGFFSPFNPLTLFQKWAAVEVSNASNVPSGFLEIKIPAGDYAVFIHKGLSSNGPETYNHIFLTWLPSSRYRLDDRPHFAIMGALYKPNDLNSEEEIWIPIKPK